MKITRIIFALCLVCFAAANFAFAQEKPKEKDKKSEQKSVEVKANVMVLDASGNLASDIKLEDLKVLEDGVEQKITYFAKKEPILNLAIVADNTGSMRTNLNEVVQISSLFVDVLKPSDEAFVVRFVDSDIIEIMQDWTSNKRLLNQALEQMFVEGGQSAVLDAIYLSAQNLLKREREDKSKRYAIVLISDVEDRDSYYNFEQTTALFKGTDLQIFIVSYAEDAVQQKKKARSLSHQLAFETGGTLYSLPKKRTKQDVVNALNKILAELRSNYVVGYTSTNQKRDGLERKLTVSVADNAKGEKRKGVMRESFIVPKD
jgi:Ca-activated chloride channel family protein